MEKALLRSLRGEAVWPPPIWLMRQAGRYLPEFRAVREKVPDFLERCLTPELAAELTLQPVRRYGFDAAIVFSDILILPWALGYGLSFDEGHGPVLPKLSTSSELDTLNPQRLPAKFAPVLETIRLVRAALDPEIALIGFAGGPFTVACYMVEGGGSRDFAQARYMAYADPGIFRRLMNLLTEATIDCLALQIEAGAHAVMLFDSWAGVLSPSLFRAHVSGPARVIVSALRARYPEVPVVGFPRLAGMMLGDYAEVARVDGVGIDTTMDPARANWLVSRRCALQGNLDPVALVAGGSVMRDEVLSILLAMRGRPFIFNLGHGIMPDTPPENVAALVSLVRGA